MKTVSQKRAVFSIFVLCSTVLHASGSENADNDKKIPVTMHVQMHESQLKALLNQPGISDITIVTPKQKARKKKSSTLQTTCNKITRGSCCTIWCCCLYQNPPVTLATTWAVYYLCQKRNQE